MPRNRNEEAPEPEFPKVWDESCREYCRFLAGFLVSRNADCSSIYNNGWGDLTRGHQEVNLAWKQVNNHVWYLHSDVTAVVVRYMRYLYATQPK